MPKFILPAAILAAVATAAAAAEPDFTVDKFRAHVAFLADDTLEGRATGSRGYDVAAAYVASTFAGLGVKPGGENGTWYQKVPFRSASLKPDSSLEIAGAEGPQRWIQGKDVLMPPSFFEAEQDLAGELVFAGYGIEAADRGIDDYRGLDVRGKIVVILEGVQSGIPSEIAAHLDSQKARVAAAKGAIGLIVAETDDSLKVFPWETRLRSTPPSRLAWIGKDGRPHDPAPGLRFTAQVQGEVATALFARARKSYAQLKATKQTAKGPKGFAIPGQVRVRRSTEWRKVESAEVIGMLPGSDPALQREYVVLTGHLDHLGINAAAAPGKDNIYNGALDNAAGIATMLEVARAYSGASRPRRSILFIANTGEEQGLLGADYFARHPTVPIGDITAVVDLDMPMLLYPFNDVIAFGAAHSEVGEAVARAAAKMGVSVAKDPMPEQGLFTRSDHYMFVRQGVPAVFLATGWGNGGEKHWNEYFNNAYHSERDDMAQKIDWEAGARYAKLNYLISRELADTPQRARWYKDDFFGNLFAPDAAKTPLPSGG